MIHETIYAILHRLKTVGVSVSLDGSGRLAIEPASLLTPEDVRLIKSKRNELVTHLKGETVREAIDETFVAVPPSLTPEEEAEERRYKMRSDAVDEYRECFGEDAPTPVLLWWPEGDRVTVMHPLQLEWLDVQARHRRDERERAKAEEVRKAKRQRMKQRGQRTLTGGDEHAVDAEHEGSRL